MNEIAEKVQAEYDEMYKICEEESICLNMEKYKSEKYFKFIERGYYLSQILDSGLFIFLRVGSCYYYKKTEDCKIVIDSISTYQMYKFLIRNLKDGIKQWEREHNDFKYLISDIKEKAIIDVLKKEMKFMKNRLKFEKLWFTRLSRY